MDQPKVLVCTAQNIQMHQKTDLIVPSIMHPNHQHHQATQRNPSKRKDQRWLSLMRKPEETINECKPVNTNSKGNLMEKDKDSTDAPQSTDTVPSNAEKSNAFISTSTNNKGSQMLSKLSCSLLCRYVWREPEAIAVIVMLFGEMLGGTGDKRNRQRLCNCVIRLLRCIPVGIGREEYLRVMIPRFEALVRGKEEPMVSIGRALLDEFKPTVHKDQ